MEELKPKNKWGIPNYYSNAIARETRKWLTSKFELTEGQCRDISDNMVRICSRYFIEAEQWYHGECCKPFLGIGKCIHDPRFNVPPATAGKSVEMDFPLDYQRGYSDGHKEGFNKALEPVVREKALRNEPIIFSPKPVDVGELRKFLLDKDYHVWHCNPKTGEIDQRIPLEIVATAIKEAMENGSV